MILHFFFYEPLIKKLSTIFHRSLLLLLPRSLWPSITLQNFAWVYSTIYIFDQNYILCIIHLFSTRATLYPITLKIQLISYNLLIPIINFQFTIWISKMMEKYILHLQKHLHPRVTILTRPKQIALLPSIYFQIFVRCNFPLQQSIHTNPSLSLSLFPSRFLPLARGDLGWSEPSKLHQHTEASSEGGGVEATFAESGRAGKADSPINFNGRNTAAASVNLTESVIETRAGTRMESYRQPRIFSRWPLANCRRPRG